MRINPTILLHGNSRTNRTCSSKRKSPTFKSYNPDATKKIVKELAQKGITCHFQNNDFVADCCKKTVNVFEQLFPKSYLPKLIEFLPLDSITYGAYYFALNKVVFNNQMNDTYFYNLCNLRKKTCAEHIAGWSSSRHPGHVFVHEFAHSAHWHHLEQKNGVENAYRVWQGLEGTTVPTPIGRLITKFKISKYAVEGKDMCEFLAERMSKDVCNKLSKDTWIPFGNIDVDYSDIFNRKWNYRYSSPQSYIDYFTQQVWNGDIEEAKRTGDMVEAYLAELENAERVSPVVKDVITYFEPTVVIPKPRQHHKQPLTNAHKIEEEHKIEVTQKIEETQPTEPYKVPEPEHDESTSFLFRLGQSLIDLNARITDKLDERNKLKLNI